MTHPIAHFCLNEGKTDLRKRIKRFVAQKLKRFVGHEAQAWPDRCIFWLDFSHPSSL
jgi:hypothetical protein